MHSLAAFLAVISTMFGLAVEGAAAPTTPTPGLLQLPLTAHHRTVESIATVERTSVAGRDVTILHPDRWSGFRPLDPVGTVIYFGGVAESADSIVNDLVMRSVITGLLSDGWEIAAISASPVNWGNQAAVATYAELGRTLDRDRVVLLAKSMGGLASLNCIATSCIDGIVAWAGIYPVTDQRHVADAFRDQVTAAFDGEPPLSHIPAENVERLAPVPMLLWASPDDTRVPAAGNGLSFAEQVGAAGGNIAVVDSDGEHGDLSHFDPDGIGQFFARAFGSALDETKS